MNDTNQGQGGDDAIMRKDFEGWYITHAFDYERDPVGSRECGLQWKAWKGCIDAITSGKIAVPGMVLVAERDALQSQLDGMLMLKRLHAEGNTMEMTLEAAQGALLPLVAASRTIVGKAENYAECHVSSGVDDYTLTIRKRFGKTPHEMRAEEAKRADAAEAELARVREELKLANEGLDAAYMTGFHKRNDEVRKLTEDVKRGDALLREWLSAGGDEEFPYERTRKHLARGEGK